MQPVTGTPFGEMFRYSEPLYQYTLGWITALDGMKWQPLAEKRSVNG
eukprot:COSAG02_NODE_2203_length_9520_cov_14.356013_9_plen_47_part_00